MKSFRDYERILVFDLETTGLDPKTASIIEVGAVDLVPDNDRFVVRDEIGAVVNVKEKLPAKIIEITNITDAMVEKGIPETELFRTLETLITPRTLLVAYNLNFDLSFLMTLFEKYGLPEQLFYDCDVLDMLTVYRDKHPFPHKLDAAVERYDVSVKNTHRALDDAKATFELFLKMNETYDLRDYINVIGHPSKYPYRGKKLPHIKYVPQ